MIKRTVVIEQAVRLSTQDEQLVIRYLGTEDLVKKVPIEDLSLVLIEHPETSLNHQLVFKKCRNFTKKLLQDGFEMYQFSIYVRFCASMENADVHSKRVRLSLPEKGRISIMRITDKQFGMIETFQGLKKAAKPKVSQQLELF